METPRMVRLGMWACANWISSHAPIKRIAKRLLGRYAGRIERFMGPCDSTESSLGPKARVTRLTSLKDVDDFLDAMRPDFTERDLRQYWDAHHLDRTAVFGVQADANPFSREYRENVVRQYTTLSGRPMNAYKNELTSSIDRNIHFSRPFPYNMKRASVSVSNMLYTFARLFRLIQVETGQRLIEFGSGWGHAALQFAQAGVSVTLVDVEKNFLDITRERFERLGMVLECMHGEFNDVSLPAGHYDYALFVSAFHHCIDHATLLSRIHRSLKDQGKIIFCDEPVTDAFPVPWGVRLDGESLWAIRRNGWLELGFQESYFRECLHAAGFALKKHQFTTEKQECIWIAKKM